MDNVTHSLFAATLGRTRIGRAGRGTTLTLVLASNAPDIDIMTAFVSGTESYLAAHRGPTHGPLGVLLLALVSAALVSAIQGVRRGRDPVPTKRAEFWPLVGVALLGTTCHVLMDLPTTYGTRLLSPFSERWFAFDWLPIIDLYLIVVLLGGLLVGFSARWRSVASVTALSLMTVNYGLHATTHATAVRQSGGSSAWTLASWDPGMAEDDDQGTDGRPPLEKCAPAARERGGPQGLCASLAAIPTFTSPFTWRIIRPSAEGYEVSIRDVLDGRESRPSLIRHEETTWTARARTSRLGSIFFRFSRFPAAVALPRDGEGGTVVRVQDVRFGFPPAGDGDPGRVRSPFVIFVELDARGAVLAEGFGGPEAR